MKKLKGLSAIVVCMIFIVFMLMESNMLASSFSLFGKDTEDNDLSERNTLVKRSRLIDEASLIFRGKVVKVDYDYVLNSNGNKFPYSIITVHVIKGFWGADDGEEITFNMVGGWIDQSSYLIDGNQLELFPEDHVVIFYNGEKYPIYASIGGNAGAFRVAIVNDREVMLDSTRHPLMAWNGGKAFIDKSIKCKRKTDNGELCNWKFRRGRQSISAEEISTLAMHVSTFDDVLEKMVENKEGPQRHIITESQFLEAYKRFVEDDVAVAN